MNVLRSALFIAFTVLIALMLSVLPFPSWSVWFAPEWVLMVLIYWAMALPQRVSVGIAWCVGLLLDVLQGMLLGENALAMTLVIYIVARFYQQMRVFPLVQQSLCILLLTLLYEIITYIIQGLIGELPHSWMYWVSPVSSMVLWSWLFIILRDYRRRFKVK